MFYATDQRHQKRVIRHEMPRKTSYNVNDLRNNTVNGGNTVKNNATDNTEDEEEVIDLNSIAGNLIHLADRANDKMAETAARQLFTKAVKQLTQAANVGRYKILLFSSDYAELFSYKPSQIGVRKKFMQMVEEAELELSLHENATTGHSYFEISFEHAKYIEPVKKEKDKEKLEENKKEELVSDNGYVSDEGYVSDNGYVTNEMCAS